MISRKTSKKKGSPASARPGRPAAGRGLESYRHRRDFKKTPEPRGDRAVSAGKRNPAFVIQRHDASHLHFDLRLEENGVLKSWAIPKTPPQVAGLKRLAVETEDHPLAYQHFEGIIPQGEYGAGRVEIWDKGTYQLLEKGPGKRLFVLHGRKMKGPFVLVKLRSADKKDKNWLFFRTQPKTEGR